MDVLNLAELLLSPDEKNELHSSMELLEQSDYSAFYEKNQSIIQSILFLETLEEFLDFSKENELYAECFCAAFLCAYGYGIQIGGYEDDLTHTLTEFSIHREWNIRKFQRLSAKKRYIRIAAIMTISKNP